MKSTALSCDRFNRHGLSVMARLLLAASLMLTASRPFRAFEIKKQILL
jgi:hypothetical protein